MKKFLQWIFFLLTILTFTYDAYIMIFGFVDVKEAYEMLAMKPGGAVGMDYWGVGADFLVIIVIVISVLCFILSVITWILAQSRIIKIVSIVILILLVIAFLIFGYSLYHIALAF